MRPAPLTLPTEVIPVIETVATRLEGCRSLLCITGAGMSADSGLPTYRGVGGLYTDRLVEEGIAIEEALSGEMLRERPEVCWRYILQIEEACRGAAPNRGHEVLAEMEQRLERMVVLTQNVDGFHRRAGTRNLIDIHGDLSRLLCTSCAYVQVVADFSGLQAPPSCPECGALVRPDVVLFNELLPMDKVARLRSELHEGFEAVLSIGTASLFPYIAEPVIAAHLRGILTVEINPGTTIVSELVDHRIQAGAAASLDHLWRCMQQAAG